MYGDARPKGVDGRPLTLVRTGRTRSMVRFSATGTIVRAVLAVPYAKYLIGKYEILPNGRLPSTWRKTITRVVGESVIK